MNKRKTVKFTNYEASEYKYAIVKIADIKAYHNITSAILSTGDIDLVYSNWEAHTVLRWTKYKEVWLSFSQR